MAKNIKINVGRYFEDFTLNEVIQHASPRTITAGDTALYIGLTGNRNPLHCSEPFAQSLGYKTAPVDNLLAFNIAFGKTVPDVSVNAVANLGYADVRFLQPIFVGDTLTTSSEVIGLKENANRKSGVVYVRSTTKNQHGETVISWVRWVMVHKANHFAPAPTTTIPDLPTFVAAKDLTISAGFSATEYDGKATAGEYYWEDYTKGDRINHPAGATINDSDHTIATHLYQNNARLHFDAQLMASSPFKKRLVYGGIVISLCRTLSFDGLENAISMLAINAGTHINPSFAGDTIYTLTTVIDSWSLSGRTDIGALRLRMIGIKNMPADQLSTIKTNDQYHESIVLDLDYTVAMPLKGVN